MARKRKKRGSPGQKKHKPPPPQPFNPVFQQLDKALAQARARHKSPAPPKSPSPEDPPEERIFLEAMEGVKPLAPSKGIVTPLPDPSLRPPHRVADEELEARTHLWELVHGVRDMDITFSDEYIEGAVRGFDRKLMARLKKGHFPVQDHIDLHGLTRQEAEVRVKEFLLRSYGLGLRCVLVVHGRGLNSRDHIPVLKERVPVWLTRGEIRKIVLAFSTARSYDGGTGAIYVLLRRKKGKPYLSRHT